MFEVRIFHVETVFVEGSTIGGHRQCHHVQLDIRPRGCVVRASSGNKRQMYKMKSYSKLVVWEWGRSSNTQTNSGYCRAVKALKLQTISIKCLAFKNQVHVKLLSITFPFLPFVSKKMVFHEKVWCNNYMYYNKRNEKMYFTWCFQWRRIQRLLRVVLRRNL